MCYQYKPEFPEPAPASSPRHVSLQPNSSQERLQSPGQDAGWAGKNDSHKGALNTKRCFYNSLRLWVQEV